MSKVVAVEYLSLDGVMQSPGRPDEDRRGGFELGGWAGRYLSNDPEAAQASMSGGTDTDGMLFGRITYLDLVGHWINDPNPNPFKQILTERTKYVASSTLDEPLEYPNSVLLKGDPIEAVRDLKQRGDGQLVLLGSGVFARGLAAAGLVDEYVLTIMPVVLGEGTRFFGETTAELEAIDTFVSPTGIVVGRYRVTG